MTLINQLRGEVAEWVIEEVKQLEAELERLRGVLGDIAEYDCAYGDNCPSNAGTRHGTCVGCKARHALEEAK